MARLLTLLSAKTGQCQGLGFVWADETGQVWARNAPLLFEQAIRKIDAFTVDETIVDA